MKPIPLAWFSVSSSPTEPPQLLPDYQMDGNSGFERVSQEQAVQKLKGLKSNYTFAPDKPAGQSLFDFYLSKPDSDETKQMLKSGNATSQNFVLLNGIFSNANDAAKMVNATPEQLKTDLATMGKIQSEQATESKRQADIKSYQDAGKPVPQELLAPGQGADNGKDGFQVGNADQGVISKTPSAQTAPATSLPDFTTQDPVVIQKLKDMGAITADNAVYAAKPTSKKTIGGIDVSGFTADQQKALEDLYNNTKTDVAAVSNPVPLSNEKILEKLLQPSTTDFLGQAKGEYAPYYTQQKEQYAKDFEEALKFETEQRKQAQVQEQLEKQIALENQAAQSAEGGLAFSGIRQKAEQRIKDQAQNIATSSRRAFEYQSGARGRQAENVLGSEYLKGLTLPAIGGASVFTPQGGVTGSLQREQMTAEQTRSAELAKQERLRNVAAIPGIDQKSLLSLASNF